LNQLLKLPVLALLLALFGTQAHAGAWLRSEAESLYAVQYEHRTADSFWDKNGNLQSLGCSFSSDTISNYYEYGYSYYHTLFAEFSLARQQCGADSVSGVEGVRLGIRGRIDPYRNGRAWEAILILPVGGQRSGRFHVGNDHLGIELGVARRETFGPELEFESGSFEVGAAVRFWAGGDPAEVISYMKGTYLLSPVWNVSGRLSASETLGGGTGLSTGEGGGSEYKLLKAAVELSHKLSTGWRVNFGIFRHTWGENVLRSEGAYMGFSRAWR
jgi:hypothetical protein